MDSFDAIQSRARQVHVGTANRERIVAGSARQRVIDHRLAVDDELIVTGAKVGIEGADPKRQAVAIGGAVDLVSQAITNPPGANAQVCKMRQVQRTTPNDGNCAQAAR